MTSATVQPSPRATMRGAAAPGVPFTSACTSARFRSTEIFAKTALSSRFYKFAMEGIMVTDSRVVAEGYGPGAWHGPDLKAALTGVTPELAYWRPGAGRHNIAEIALH